MSQNIIMDKKYFKNKNILITGITGFIGSHLSKRLEIFGANVYGISHSKEGENIFKINVTEYSTLDEIIKKKKIDICFHLAAESLVESGQADPYQTFKVNTLGTLNILEIARKNNIKKLIIASTAHVYGNNKLPFREIYQPKPSRPYETSKTCTDLVAQSYADTFNLPVLIPRFINIYGPEDLNFNRLIPKTIKSILDDEAPVMWGGGATRDYLYIDDAIHAYLCLAEINMEKVGENRIFNFGSNNIISVKDLMQKLIDISGKNLKIQKIEDGRENEIKKQYVSWTKAKRILHWQPSTDLNEGLRNTLSWYQSYFKKK